MMILLACKGQQIKNSGFEVEGGWHPGYNSNENITIDREEKFCGKKSLLINNKESKLSYCNQTFNYTCEAFEKIFIKFHVKGILDEASTINLWVNSYNKRKILYSIPIKSNESIPQWKEMSLSLILPPETDGIQIGMSLNGKGRVWFDEFSLKKKTIEQQDTSYSRSTKKYISEVVNIIKEHALNKDSLNYKQDVQKALKLSNFNEKKEYLSVRYLLRKLRDRHSAFIEKEEKSNSTNNVVDRSLPSGKIVQDSFAYIHLPTLSVTVDSFYHDYADTLYKTITDLNKYVPKFWILDLRGNKGGVVWPMIAGLGPLLEDGIQGYFVYRNSKRRPWIYKNGKAYSSKDSKFEIKDKNFNKIDRSNSRVLMLTDGTTASAAEMIAVMLRGYKNTLIVGKKSRGLTSGNSTFTLSDGSILRLTTSRYMDKNGKVYTGKIIPDIQIDLGVKEPLCVLPLDSLSEKADQLLNLKR